MRGGRRATAVVLPRQGETLLDERLHFLKIVLQLFLGVAVTQEIGAQPHARDRGLKIVRDRRQNLDPFRNLLGDAPLHGVERGSGARHFLRTIFRQGLTAQIRAQAVRRMLEARQRVRRELHGKPDEECDDAELNSERRRQPGRNDFPRREDSRASAGCRPSGASGCPFLDSSNTNEPSRETKKKKRLRRIAASQRIRWMVKRVQGKWRGKPLLGS